MSSELLALLTGCIIVALRGFFAWRMRNYPLNHGPAYFFGVAVPPGFYEAAGARWLRGYRTLLAAQYLLLFSVFTAVVLSGEWKRMPILAPVDVISLFTLVGGFMQWARRAVGAPPATVTRVAVPLAIRRLGDYISWPAEVLMLALLAASWVILLRSGAPFDWSWPVASTYVALATLPGKILLVRNSFPLAPERTEEYHRWLEVQRRHGLRVMDAMRWLVVAILAGHVAQHAWHGVAAIGWIRCAWLAVVGAIFTAMMAVLIRGWARIEAMGRDLRPVGSFQSPYRPASLFLRGGLTWGIAYCAGLVALLVFFRH
jgi:hypothetical protein